jgi:hypothetical protein
VVFIDRLIQSLSRPSALVHNRLRHAAKELGRDETAIYARLMAHFNINIIYSRISVSKVECYYVQENDGPIHGPI